MQRLEFERLKSAFGERPVAISNIKLPIGPAIGMSVPAAGKKGAGVLRDKPNIDGKKTAVKMLNLHRRISYLMETRSIIII